MIVLTMRFLSGRFHATPWGHHVNEGIPEWPPSPWRILRALRAASHELGESPAAVQRLFAKLALHPSYRLPQASVGHTRHYLSLNQTERSKTALTFDTFVAVSAAEPVVAQWPGDLDDEDRELLRRLAGRLSYLGRAESWCAIKVVDAAVETNCRPSNGSSTPGHETIRLLGVTEAVTLDDLDRTTAQLQKQGWSDPPGSRWIFYERRSDALDAPNAPMRPASRPTVTVAEIALGGTPLPRLIDAVRVADSLRIAALFRHGAKSRTLSGKDDAGERLLDQHLHAHYLPDSRNDRRGRITHVCVWAPGGLAPSEQDAIARIDRLKLGRPGARDESVRVVPAVFCGFGSPDDLRSRSDLFARSRTWRSRTPMVLPRHPRRGREAPAMQLARELALRGFPAPVEIRSSEGAPLVSDTTAGVTRWLEFEVRRWRRAPTTPAVGFEITFAEPQEGPIVLGWGSHFGLGSFEAVDR